MGDSWELRFKDQPLTLSQLKAYAADGQDDVDVLYSRLHSLTPLQLNKVEEFITNLQMESDSAQG